MQNTYLFGFATFGHPNDYRQSPFKVDKEEIAKKIPIFDLTNAIKIFPGSTLYAVRKENINGSQGISYAIYTYAKEMSSSREGTFIGSGILFTNEIADENITITKLNDFHSILVNRNTSNQTLSVNHSKDFQHSEKFLNEFENQAYHFKPIHEPENFKSTDKHIVILSHIDPHTLTGNFKKSLLLLNKYDTIFFTDSREITDYCKSRNIYSVNDETGFDQEINTIREQRNLKLLKSVTLFEQEKQKLTKDKKDVLTDLDDQISTIEIEHAENLKIIKEANEAVGKVNALYAEFSDVVDDYINQLHSGKKLEQIKDLYNEKKRDFVKSIAELKPTATVKKLQKVKTGSKLYVDKQSASTSKSGHKTSKSDFRSGNTKLNYYKIAAFALAFLWVLTIILFVLFSLKSNNEIQDDSIVQQQAPIQQIAPPPPPKVVELNPIPNDSLNKHDLQLILKERIVGKSAAQIVDIIFTKNPTQIGNYYKDQKGIYEQVLISKNEKCFVGDSCVDGGLVSVPGFKKQ